MKNTESITLGVGDLSINNVDSGYLSGDVTVTTEMDKVDFTHGTHKTLVKRFVTTLGRSIKASLAQIDMDTLKLAYGIGELNQNGNNARLSFGNNWDLPVLENVKFVHTRADGKKVTVFFPKAQVEPGSSELKFSADSVILQDVTITAVEDLSRSDCPLGFIQVGDSDGTNVAGPPPAENNNGGSSGGAAEGGGSGESTVTAVTDETVSGEAEETWYNYQLAHANVVQDPAPVVKSSDGSTTYTENTDYIFDYTEGIITTNECGSTTLTGGASIKVSYSYDSSPASGSGGGSGT